MRTAGVVLVLAACSAGSQPPQPPLVYELGTRSAEPFARPPADPSPAVFIDDVATTRISLEYEDLEAAVADPHHIELRHGSTVIASLDIGPSADSCSQVEGVTRYVESICRFDTGDLRFDSDSVTGRDGGCIGDGFCLDARCFSCSPDERCTSRIVLREPLSSHLGCAPVGPKQAGEACALIDDPDGAFDDCGESLLCVEGRCQHLCTPEIGPCEVTSERCTFIPGHDASLGICR